MICLNTVSLTHSLIHLVILQAVWPTDLCRNSSRPFVVQWKCNLVDYPLSYTKAYGLQWYPTCTTGHFLKSNCVQGNATWQDVWLWSLRLYKGRLPLPDISAAIRDNQLQSNFLSTLQYASQITHWCCTVVTFFSLVLKSQTDLAVFCRFIPRNQYKCISLGQLGIWVSAGRPTEPPFVAEQALMLSNVRKQTNRMFWKKKCILLKCSWIWGELCLCFRFVFWFWSLEPGWRQ